MKIYLAGAVALVAGLALAASSNAAVVLSDNFDAAVPDQLNWAGDSVFLATSPPGSVDLIGAGGSFDFYPGNGSYLDLDGSSGTGNDPAGEITSILSFGPGSYTLSFYLGGNARGAPAQTTRVILGDFSTDITLASGNPLTHYTFSFNTASAGSLIFRELGPSNQQGNILDNVSLAVPEPATWAMMILGFGGVGAMVRRRHGLRAAA
jgi:hypothetical protein